MSSGVCRRLSNSSILDASWSPDGLRLATVDRDLRITLWDAAAGQALVTLDTEAEFVRFTQDGDYLMVINPRGSMHVLDGSGHTGDGERNAVLSPTLHQRISRTGVPDLRLVAFLRPRSVAQTLNNSIHCVAIVAPYVYALSRNGTLWTYSIPVTTDASEVTVLHEGKSVETGGHDMIVLTENTLIVAAPDRKLAMFSLDDPLEPTLLGQFGPQRETISSQLLVRGDGLFHFGEQRLDSGTVGGFLTVCDIQNPRRPTLLGATSYPNKLVSGCAATNWLRFEPIAISAGGGTSLIVNRGGQTLLVLNGSIWRRVAKQWSLSGRIPAAQQHDGAPYRAAHHGSYLAIPGDDQVWLYRGQTDEFHPSSPQ